MTEQLKISERLSLPIDVITEALAILARRGRGKTYAASVLAEEMLKKLVQIVVIDPTGAWWGLRSSADGSKGGYPIIIMGGEHGDVPLEPSAGAAVADFVVQERFSVVLDLSLFESRADEIRFMTAFAERLYRAKKKGTGVLHVFVDEASVFCPQRVEGAVAKMVGAMEAIVRRGRIKGIGCTLIDQRPASVNKNVLTQAKGLIVLGISSPTDRKAITLWIDSRGADEAKAVVDELPSMGVGEAWLWFPDLDVVEKVQIRQRETFDSSASPRAGEQAIQPRQWSEVDLEVVAARMAETIERAKADDPAELRKQIRERDRDLKALQLTVRKLESKAPTPREVEVPVEVPVEVLVPVLDKKDRDHIWAVLKDLGAQFDRIEKKLNETSKGTSERTSAPIKSAPKSHTPRSASPRRAAARDISPDIDGDFRPSKPQEKILNAIAWCNAVGIAYPRRQIVAAIAGVSSKSSGFEKNVSTLRTNGYLDYPDGGRLGLTQIGEATAVLPDIPLDEASLQNAICSMVGNAKANLLRVLIEAYPDPLTREELAERAGVSVASSGYEKNVSTLKSWELIEYPGKGLVAALPLLFVAGD